MLELTHATRGIFTIEQMDFFFLAFSRHELKTPPVILSDVHALVGQRKKGNFILCYVNLKNALRLFSSIPDGNFAKNFLDYCNVQFSSADLNNFSCRAIRRKTAF